MPPSEIRKDAREALRGKWGKAVLIILAFFLISFIIGFVQILVGEKSILYSIIELAYTIISIPLSFGLIISFMKLKRDEEVKAFDFLKEGFSRFSKSWGIAWHTLVRMLLPIVCIFLIVIVMVGLTILNGTLSPWITILGIALYIATLIYAVSRGLLYSLVYYVGYDNPELTSKECVLKSEELMKGNRGNIFLLELSFIGWALLAGLTLGIGMLWLLPYMQVAFICFYEKVTNKNVNVDAIKTAE